MIDWNELWKIMNLRRARALNIKFWDLEADNSDELNELMKDLTKKQIEMLDIDYNETLLEIGPGWGRLTIPLAKMVKEICVVEPSKNMIEKLQKNAQLNGLNNIRIINKRWEDVDDLLEYDVVLASFSLLMLDLKKALEKMNSTAKERVYIFASADEWMPRGIQKALFNDDIKIYSDYIIILNLLYSIGIRANVQILDYEYKRCFNSFEEALRAFSDIYNFLKLDEDILRNYLKNSLIEMTNGFCYKDQKKVALIWWRK
ncbi:MAG: class I SAM-dependent methyltransferase [Candidatus Methanomethylicaceae archaeon]